VQDLADEAFADLLAKHHRPSMLEDALKERSRREPANEEQATQAARVVMSEQFQPERGCCGGHRGPRAGPS